MYELMGRAHAALVVARGVVARERGQGTVEYVGLVLLVAVLIAGVVAASDKLGDGDGIAKSITKKLNDAIKGVGEGG